MKITVTESRSVAFSGWVGGQFGAGGRDYQWP